MAEKVSKIVLYLLMLAMLLSGLSNTVVMKLQNSQTYFNYDREKYMEYNHPFFQTFCMFVGELLCLPIYLLLKHFTKQKYLK